VQPADAYRGIAAQLIERRAEQRALDALDDLVSELGGLREERKAVIVVSQGWRLLEPKPALVKLQECDQAPLPGMPGVGPTGRIVTDVGAAQSGRSGVTRATCVAQATQYAMTDNASLFRQLGERANRFNVSFYPIDTRGLAAFDRSIGARDDRIRGDPGERSEVGRGERGPLGRDGDRLANRVSSLRTLAEMTDGLAIVNTNDLAGGARRIVNDLSTYYLLGYQSTNTKLDGRWRAISVRVKTPGIQVRARKGYRGLTEAELARQRRGEVPAATGAPVGPGQVAVTGAAAVSRIIEPLAGLERSLPWRSRAAWSTGPSPGRTRFWIASELDETTIRQPEWAGGGAGTATLALADGRRLGEVPLTFAPGARSFEASMDADVPASAEVMVRLRLNPAGGGLPLSDTLRVTPAGTPAPARLFRRGPTTGRQFVAAGQPKFRRTEHARVVVPIAGASSAIEAALIDRTGAPLRVPVSSRVETVDGTPCAIGEVSLAPLSPGDYVLRLVVGQGADAATSSTAIRIAN
jgi:VWFA-related protein